MSRRRRRFETEPAGRRQRARPYHPLSTDVEYRYADRELSWLSFNARVLQEAADPSVPLLERVKFLAIYSSNLDEFFRVRVARLRSLADVDDGEAAASRFAHRLWEIRRMVTAQQERFGRIYRQGILPDLARHGLHILDDRSVDATQRDHACAYFTETLRPHIDPVFLDPDATEPEVPFLENNTLYLVATLWPLHVPAAHPRYVLVRVPAPPVHRFVEVPSEDGRAFLFLDDVVRLGLPDLLPAYELGTAYAVKLSRDAELYLGDETEGDLVAKIRENLARRKTGPPCRFLYDPAMPFALSALLKTRLALADEDMVLGGRYHNFSDFLGFPPHADRGADVEWRGLYFEPLPPLDHPDLEDAPSILAAIAEQDHLLHFPYQRYDYVLRFLDEAARDEAVEAIWITLYRVAPDSGVTQALLEAARRGKRVVAFVEVKARFDEAPNLRWAQKLEAAGVHVLYSMPDIKVHTKIALVSRREGDGARLYAYLGTGNFNERTARIYADHALLTADPRLTREVRAVFGYLCGETETAVFEHLLVAPFTLRKGLYRLIDAEVAHARAGRRGALVAKMNAVEDEDVIDRLYAAIEAGVDVRLVVRGICRLVPEEEGEQRPLVTSIVGRFLEHARIYRFHDDGNDHLYLASADWMTRNLSRRVEVAFPIYDDRLRRELDDILDLQLRDNTKARRLDTAQRNDYHRPAGPPVHAQADTYRMLEARLRLARTAEAARATSTAEAEAVREGTGE